MPVADYFSANYTEARKKFCAAARGAAAKQESYRLPDHVAFNREELAIDVAWIGPGDARSILILISGVHGVEGFCGSGCQVGYLIDRQHDALPDGAAVMLIHALNPYGFACGRRVNESNIDLNRNFLDFSGPLPSSEAYERLHPLLVPDDWEGPKRKEADDALKQHYANDKLREFQAILTRGQYTRPTGLFYGGTSASWSNQKLHQILDQYVTSEAKRLAVIDFHTGLGPPGYGEPIYTAADDEGYQRARNWYGPEVKRLKDSGPDAAVSAVVTGDVSNAFRGRCQEVTYIALEFGTVPTLEVLNALRGDHWLHAVPNRQTHLRRAVEDSMRRAFFDDRSFWKAAVYGRASDFILRASRKFDNSSQPTST